MGKTKILFISPEMTPFLELTNISRITRQLPQSMQEKGCEIRVLVPRFGCINERRNRLHEVIRLSGMNIVINDTDNPLIIKVASLPSARMQVYFLDNEEYFQRKHVFTDSKNNFYSDNDERMIFFCKGAIETVKKLGWAPDLVHCHGWMSSLVPMYLRTAYRDDPMYKNAKVVYSIYDDAFGENMAANLSSKAIMNDMEEKDTVLLKDTDCNSLHRNAIHYSDGIVKAAQTVSGDLDAIIKSSNKPVLEPQTEENYDAYFQFFEELVSEELVGA